MGAVADIRRTWARGPAPVIRDHLSRGADETRALAVVMLGSALVWIGQWPRLMREAEAFAAAPDGGPGFQQLVGTALVSWVMLVPLLLYLAAGLAHLASRALGGRGTGSGARFALFWAWLAAAPLALLAGLAAGLVGASPLSNLLGIGWLAAVAVLWALGQREAASAGPA